MNDGTFGIRGVPVAAPAELRGSAAAEMLPAIKAIPKPVTLNQWMDWLSMVLPLLRLLHQGKSAETTRFLFDDLSKSLIVEQFARHLMLGHEPEDAAEQMVLQWALQLLP